MTTNAVHSPAEVTAILNQLVNDKTTIKFTKREQGGYFVECNDLRLGWVVKSYGSSKWSAYTYDDRQEYGVIKLGFQSSTRQDGSDSLADMLGRFGSSREEFEVAAERRYCAQQRLLATAAL